MCVTDNTCMNFTKKFLITGFCLTLAAVLALGASFLQPGCKNCDCDKSRAVSAPLKGSEPVITAKAAFLIEANSGKVLFTKDENKRLPIASMVKITTLAVIYDALEAGQIKMGDMVMVSREASGMGGSQAFLDFDSEYSVSDLIKSIVIASANDSCVALAELIAGSEADFVVKMNELAEKLGMTNTNYVNCTGLPAAESYSCAADVAKVYRYIMKSPFYGEFNKVWMYDLTHPSGRVTGLTNTNRHARFYSGCEGGKTGFTSEAGHCITVTATRGSLKPVAVIIGADNSQTRFAESGNLMSYVFDCYENKLVVSAAKPLGTVKVRGAECESMEVFAKQNFYDLSKKGEKGKPEVNVDFAGSVRAPFTANDALGKVVVTDDGKVVAEIDVVAAADVPAITYWGAVKKVVGGFKL